MPNFRKKGSLFVLNVIGGSLLVGCCLLCCLLFVVCCLLFVVCCLFLGYFVVCLFCHLIFFVSCLLFVRCSFCARFVILHLSTCFR